VSEARLDPQLPAAARLWAAHHHPYLASAVFATQLVGQPGSGGVACDEAWRIYVDPEIAGGWSAPQLGAELVHQTGHLLRGHADRARALGLSEDELQHWVDSAHADINDDLTAEVRAALDAATPYDLDSADGLFAEEYFHHGDPRRDAQRDCGSGAHGFERGWDRPPRGDDGSDGGVSEDEAELLRRRVASDVQEHEKREGGAPAGLLRWAQSVLVPSVDWRRELGAEIRRGIDTVAGAADYSYSRPSRRSSVSGAVVLPRLRQRSAEIGVVVDTSASMTDELLGLALTEIDGLLSAAGIRPDSVRVLTCDVDPTPAQRVRSSHQIELVGGGGTDMAEGMARVLDLRPRPDVVVVVTDGHTPWPTDSPTASRVVVALLGDDAPAAPPWAHEVRVT